MQKLADGTSTLTDNNDTLRDGTKTLSDGAKELSDGAKTLADGTKTLTDNNTVCIELTDSGKPFNPLAKADPDTSLSASERKIGGLGIFMVKKMMDKVEYLRYDNCNKLYLYKKI